MKVCFENLEDIDSLCLTKVLEACCWMKDLTMFQQVYRCSSWSNMHRCDSARHSPQTRLLDISGEQRY